MKSPTLVCADILEGFLSLDSPEAFASLQRSTKKKPEPQFVLEFSSPEGVCLGDSENDPDFNKKLNEYVKQTEELRSQLDSQTTQLGRAIKAVAVCLTAMKATYRQLASLNMTENRTAKELYVSMADACSSWSSYESFKASRIEDSLTKHYLYQTNDLGPLKDLIKERDLNYSTFVRTEARVLAHKEQLWSQGKLNAWELSEKDRGLGADLLDDKDLALSKMLAADTAYVDSLMDRFAYYNAQVRSETGRVLRLGLMSDIAALKDFSKREAEHCTSLHLTWMKLCAKLTDLGCGLA